MLLGPPGAGKTRLAIALGRAAIREGYSVMSRSASALVAGRAQTRAEGRLEERLGFCGKPKVLIVEGATNSALWSTPIAERLRLPHEPHVHALEASDLGQFRNWLSQEAEWLPGRTTCDKVSNGRTSR